MALQLPRLRLGLDIMPSPVVERPGLLVRDPFRYTEDILIIPPLLARGLALFDGEQTELDLQVHLSRLAGEIIPREIVESLVSGLKDHGFLETDEFEQRRAVRHAEFAGAQYRHPAHAGSAYADKKEELTLQLNGYFDSDQTSPAAGDPISHQTRVALAAPHVSPEGGVNCYAAAYRPLQQPNSVDPGDKTIVLLGTSHYGQPERFGLTRKPFLTPFGSLRVDTDMVDWLESRAPGAVVMEDYCHSIEHSIEFQCVFLQHAIGSSFRILPILCGPFAEATLTGETPESDESVRRFFDALAEMSHLHRSGSLFWVIGVDMAHIGRRYGDQQAARANEGQMIDVAEQDRARLDRVCAGDAEGFLALVAENRDPLKWCGFSPLYTFLRAVDGVRGNVIKYDQWNIDEQSVVTFAALEFTHGPRTL